MADRDADGHPAAREDPALLRIISTRSRTSWARAAGRGMGLLAIATDR